MNKIIYFVDQGLIRQKIVTTDYQLKDCETEIVPENILEPAEIINGEWVSATVKSHTELFGAAQPTAEQLSITTIAQQSADNEQHIKSIEEAITAFAQANGGK